MEDDKIQFFTLKGNKLLAINCNSALRLAVIATSHGHFAIDHAQECCESVTLYRADICAASINEEIIEASEEFLNEHPPFYKPSGCEESFTWSVYKIHTESGISTLYFLGESNGYYGETTSVRKIV